MCVCVWGGGGGTTPYQVSRPYCDSEVYTLRAMQNVCHSMVALLYAVYAVLVSEFCNTCVHYNL